MPLGLRKFKVGGTEYPLTASTTNSLLRDGDPALYYAGDLFETVIKEYVGARLLAQAALVNLAFPSAVARRIHFEPSPFLQAHDMVFPLFALYRSEGNVDFQNIAFEKFSTVWTWAYLLPPMTPEQIEKLDPILHNVADIVSLFAMQSYDPKWESGKTLRDLSGIQKMVAGPYRHLDVEMLDGGQNEWWRGVQGKIFVQESSGIVLDDLDVFEGANVKVDLDPGALDAKIESFVEADMGLPPVITQVLPASGSKAGSVPLEIVGTGFRPGTPLKILVGGSYASSVYVASPFRATALTPAHDASPTFMADVQVIDVDDQASNVLTGAYTFTTP